MNRDFSNESVINFLFRFIKSINVRLRGILYRLLHMFFDNKCKGLCIGLNPRIINSKSIKIGKNVSLGNFVRIECFNSNKNNVQLIIGDESSFGDYLHIGVATKVIIGNGVLGGSNILIIDHNHGITNQIELENLDVIPRNRQIISKGNIIIEDNVWIGDKVCILGGVTIGKGAVIAAGAIVRKNVESYSIHF